MGGWHGGAQWLMMRSHAQGEIRVHSRELGAVGVGGDNDNGGDDDTRLCSSAGSKGSRGRGVGRPRKAQRTSPPSPQCPRRAPHCPSGGLAAAAAGQPAPMATTGSGGGGRGFSVEGEAGGCPAGCPVRPGRGEGGGDGEGPAPCAGEGGGGTQVKGSGAAEATTTATAARGLGPRE